MSQNSEALKRGYDAFNSGDADALAELYADDVRWEGPNTDGVPMSGEYDGKKAVLEGLAQIGEDFESFDVSADEMIEQGETIVVLSHIQAKTKSGNELSVPGVEVWRMSDGLAQRVQTLIDTAEVKTALAG